MIQIKNRYDGTIIFTSQESKTLGEAVKVALATGADLRSADLRSADLRSADLRSADLRYADLRYADLRYANLRYANLQSADLQSADLQSIRNDFWDVLLRAQAEIKGLRKALVSGKVDGSTYEGECACLVGTIANVKCCAYSAIENLKPDSNRPIERFFLAISKGSTPENSDACKIAVDWIDEFQSLMRSDAKDVKLVEVSE